MTKLFVIFNPAARGEKAGRLRRLLEARTNRHVRLAPTRRPHEASELAAQAVRDGFRVIIAAGGDGTINEVVNGLGGADVALGVLPAGTVNVFARELDIPLGLKAAWAVIEQGRTRAIDLGVATTHQPPPQSGTGIRPVAGSADRDPSNSADRSSDSESERLLAAPAAGPTPSSTRYFVQLAGAGFDARAVERASWALKKRIGPLSYLWAGCEAMVQPGPAIELDGDYRGPAVLVGNGRFYGGPFPMFPRARLDDGLLDVCLFERFRWRDLLRFVPAIARGQHLALRDVKYFQVRELECRAAGSAPFELDGELAGRTPVRFSVAPGALRVIVP